MIKDTKQVFNNPYLWGSCTLLASSLMIVGWARSYPVDRSPAEISVLSVVSPLFWIGLCGGFLGLAGLVLTSRSKFVHWISSCSFVLLLTAPQFLYLSWGSDAGALAGFVDFAQTLGKFTDHRITEIHPYFQWPMSIFFHQFLKDALNVDVYTAVQIGFLFVSLSVGGTLFALWFDPMFQGPQASMGAFWGIVVYFAGFYWFLNWQAVPYAFSLALFMPILILLERRTFQHRVLLLLLFCVGLDTHALFGVWAILLVLVIMVGTPVLRWIGQFLSQRVPQSGWQGRIAKSALRLLPIADPKERKPLTLSLVLLMVVLQTAVIIYKNSRFFDYVVSDLKGYYNAMLVTGATHKSLAIQTGLALKVMPLDLVGMILKVLSFLDLGIIAIALVVAALDVLVNHKLRFRDMAFFGAGVIYFLIGTKFAALGERSFQLLGMLPAFFVAQSIDWRTRLGKIVMIASVAGLLLFPAAIVRTHQMSANYVRPDGVFFEQVVGELDPIPLKDITFLSEHVRPLKLGQNLRLMTTRLIQNGYVQSCEGPMLVVDTAQFRQDMGQIVGYTSNTLDSVLSHAPVFYDSHLITLYFVRECSALELVVQKYNNSQASSTLREDDGRRTSSKH